MFKYLTNYFFFSIKKKTLKLLSDKQKQREIERANKNLLPKENSEEEIDEEKIEYQEDKLESIEPAEENDEEEKANNLNEKRAITYEMAKNKGLTPKRRKELRNPRVKNRKKYEKARIRRKGQVESEKKEKIIAWNN